MIETQTCLFKLSREDICQEVTRLLEERPTEEIYAKLKEAVSERNEATRGLAHLEKEGRNYLYKTGTIVASSPVLGIFVNAIGWDKPSNGICHLSQPAVNHRDIEGIHFDKMYAAFLADELNLANTTFVVSGYAVDMKMTDDTAVDPCYVADNSDRSELFRDPRIPVPLDTFMDQLMLFFNLVAEVDYLEMYPEDEDPDWNNSYTGSMKLFARLFQHLHCRFSGFNSRNKVKAYFELLLTFLYGDAGVNKLDTEDVPAYFGVLPDSDYATFYRATSFLQQALFPFRVCTIDGNHRLPSFLVIIFGGHKRGKVPVDTVINLENVCVDSNVQFYYAKYDHGGLANLPSKVRSILRYTHIFDSRIESCGNWWFGIRFQENHKFRFANRSLWDY
jgi:hypothetical protein